MNFCQPSFRLVVVSLRPRGPLVVQFNPAESLRWAGRNKPPFVREITAALAAFVGKRRIDKVTVGGGY